MTDVKLDDLSDDDLLHQMTSTFARLDQWRVVAASEFTPMSNSELAIDDLDWPPHRVSEIGRQGFLAAVDHLRAVQVLVEARQLFPLAQPSMLRAALIGASQAVWVLAPDDRTIRLRRARLFARWSLDQHRQAIGLIGADTNTAHTDDVLDLVRQRLRELDAKRADEHERGPMWTTTDIIRDAAHTCFPPELVDQVGLMWRVTSGAAHGLMWQTLGVRDTRAVTGVDKDGMAVFGAAGGIRRISNEYHAAYAVAATAWSLLRRRAGIDVDV